MTKKKLRSPADSSALSIVIIGLTIVIVGCFLGITYLFEYDFYDNNNNGETAKSVAVQIYSLDDCEKAKDFNLLIVPGTGFGCPGHTRISFCVPTERVERALEAFKKLAEFYR